MAPLARGLGRVLAPMMKDGSRDCDRDDQHVPVHQTQVAAPHLVAPYPVSMPHAPPADHMSAESTPTVSQPGPTQRGTKVWPHHARRFSESRLANRCTAPLPEVATLNVKASTTETGHPRSAQVPALQAIALLPGSDADWTGQSAIQYDH